MLPAAVYDQPVARRQPMAETPSDQKGTLPIASSAEIAPNVQALSVRSATRQCRQRSRESGRWTGRCAEE